MEFSVTDDPRGEMNYISVIREDCVLIPELACGPDQSNDVASERVVTSPLGTSVTENSSLGLSLFRSSESYSWRIASIGDNLAARKAG